MTELLRLAARERLETVSGKHFARGALDERRGYQVVGGKLKIAVVLHQTDEFDLGESDAVEAVEVSVLERLRNLNHTVRAEVGNDDRVVVLDGAHSLARLVDDHERLDVLIAVTTLL